MGITSCSCNFQETLHQMCSKLTWSSCSCWMFHHVSGPAEDQYLYTDLQIELDLDEKNICHVISSPHHSSHHQLSRKYFRIVAKDSARLCEWQIRCKLPSKITWAWCHLSLGVLRQRWAQRKASRTSFIAAVGKEGLPVRSTAFLGRFPVFLDNLPLSPRPLSSTHRKIAWMIWNWQTQMIAPSQTKG